MIEPKPAQRPNGLTAPQHGLAKLTDTLASLATGQTAQHHRDIQIQQQLITLTQQVGTMTQTIRWGLAGLGVLVVALVALVGWQIWRPPHTAYARALGSLDSVLAQEWGKLPKNTQQSLEVVYSRMGVSSPGERQLPRK